MTDEAKPSLKEIAYVGDVTANATCPFCQNMRWSYAVNEDGTPWHSLVSYVRDGRAISLPAIVLTCDRCGFVRHHDLAMVRLRNAEGRNGG
mgnify:CR=1 FL=1